MEGLTLHNVTSKTWRLTWRPAWRKAAIITWLAFSGFIAPSTHAADNEGAAESAAKAWAEELWKAIGLHNRARMGQKGAARDAVSLLKKLLKEQPEHSIALAYLGSSYVIRARDVSDIDRKTKYVERGLRHLDQAVDISPDNFVVLTVSTNVNRNLPRTLGRGKTAREHALALDAIYSANPDPRRAMHMAPIYGYLHQQAEDAGDAEAAATWQQKAEQARQQAAKARSAE